MILLVDNYDSFTYNLAQAFQTLGQEVMVRRNDAIAVAEVVRLAPLALVLSPGPGRPEAAGATPSLIRDLRGRLPILGVCLGHQAIGLACGGLVERALPVHGKASFIEHDGEGLFATLPQPMQVGRYHSLVVNAATLPRELIVQARTADGLVMAVAHRTEPLWGVQFHPESVLTPDGNRLLARFLALARAA